MPGAAVAGAVAAAWAPRQSWRDELASWARWVQLITAIGVVTLGVTLVPASVTAGWPGPVGLRIAAAVEAILRMCRSSSSSRRSRSAACSMRMSTVPARQWPSALFVSALWGVWHLPVAAAGQPLLVTIGQMIVVHCLDRHSDVTGMAADRKPDGAGDRTRPDRRLPQRADDRPVTSARAVISRPAQHPPAQPADRRATSP